MDKIAQLDAYVANALNMKDGTFLGKPVFNISFEKQNSIDWNGVDKLYPDQISASASTAYFSSKNTLLLETESDYDRVYSASIDAEYSGVTYSGSVSSSYMYHGNLFESASSTYGLDYYVQAVLAFKRLSPVSADDLDAKFVAALTALPTDISTDAARAQYISLFNSYGTHYLAGGSVGGSIIMETEIADSLFKTTTVTEVKAAVSGGYQGVVASGKISASAAYNASDFLKEHRNSISISLSVMGGLYAPDGSISDWQKSIYTSPIILLAVPAQTPTLSSQLLCISRLAVVAGIANANVIAKNIEAILEVYIDVADDSDGLITSAKDISLNAVAAVNKGAGFVLASIKQTSNGDRGWIWGFDDNVMDPKQMRACASQHYYTGSDVWAPSASFLMPVTQDSNYKTTAERTCGSPIMEASFVGFGNSENPTLGAYESRDVNKPYTAESDGFVVAYIAANNNGERGYLQGQIVGGGCYAGASVHNYAGSDHLVPYNSFTMPVKKGDTYNIMYYPTYGTPATGAFFVPVNQAVAAFGSYETLTANHEYTATTDGMLIAYLDANGNGNRGEVTISCYPDKSDPTALATNAYASVHDYHENDSWLTYQAAAIPVPKGSYFNSSLIATYGSPKLNLFWVSIGQAGNGSMTAIAVNPASH